MNAQKILVWDLPTRVFHWLLAGNFAIAYLTAEEASWQNVHFTAGYTVLGLIAFRLVWGLVCSRYARFSQFAYRPGQILDYVKNMKERHFLGHNPAGSIAVVALLGLGIVAGVTGVILLLSGSEWLEEPHELAANLMLALVCLHVAGVVISSKLHGENLSRAMVTGQKQGESQDAIPGASPVIGIVVLAAVIGFWGFAITHPFDTGNLENKEQAGQHDDGD